MTKDLMLEFNREYKRKKIKLKKKGIIRKIKFMREI